MGKVKWINIWAAQIGLWGLKKWGCVKNKVGCVEKGVEPGKRQMWI